MERFRMDCKPVARKENVFFAPHARFTVLGDKIIRCEYSREDIFEDRATQHIINRDTDLYVGEIKTNEENGVFTLETESLALTYDSSCEKLKGLSINCKKLDKVWSYGDVDEENLFGTYRTLDNCDGSHMKDMKAKIQLSKGLNSRNGWSVIDDSSTLIFDEASMLQKRTNSNEFDIYFFAYGNDYKQCLSDYYKIAGSIPLVPKWALGIWWSRWMRYSQEDILSNAAKFEEAGAPLSAHVIDMDWHIVDNEYTNGWTGYTWNKELFPNPKGMFDELHKKGIHACMNLHPADGVWPHEDQYEEMAKYMGIDPATKQPVEFDIADKKFIKAYFDILHHPLEEEGVDFWWIDWQQGTKSKLDGLDPLWYLNHLHSLDLKRDGKKRQMTFSRWADNGCHRYPIGFSGDTYSTWDTVKFLPFFNSTAANVGYGWWSNDVGGFARGDHRDHELYTRWVQSAVFSPIFRLHNCGDPTLDYMPWTKPEPYSTAAIDILKLRNALLPYLYTAAYKNANGEPTLCRPMYMDYPDQEEAYHFETQYMFGDSMIVSPFVEPADEETGFSRALVWLPEGGWYNLFTGEYYDKPGVYAIYGELKDVPVFVKAGHTIPIDICGETVLVAYPGNGKSIVYNDDGETMNYQNGEFTLDTVEQELVDGRLHLAIKDKAGKEAAYKVKVVDKDFDLFELLKGTEELEARATLEAQTNATVFSYGLSYDEFFKLVKHFKVLGHTCRPVLAAFDEWSKDLNKFKPFISDFTDAQMKCLVEVFTGCVFDVLEKYDGSYVFVYFNPTGDEKFTVDMGHRYDYWYEERSFRAKDRLVVENFKNKSNFHNWLGWANYGDIMHIKKLCTNK